MKKRLVALALSLCLLPAVSFALLPLGFGLALVSGVTESSLILPLIGASAAIGTAIAFVTFGGSPGQPASSAPIVAQIDPKAPLPTPAGWSAPPAGQVQPVPPSSTSSRSCWSGASNASAVACDAAAATDAQSAGDKQAAVLGYVRGDGPAATSSGGAQGGGTWYGCAVGSETCWATNNGKRTISMWVATGCAAGYTLSSGSCNLTTPSAVQKPVDGRCYIIRSGNSYSSDPQDPDCSGGGFPAQWSAGSNTLSLGPLPDGTGGGSVTIDAATSKATVVNNTNNSDGTQRQDKVEIGAPDGGSSPGSTKVLGTSSSTVAGSGTLASGASSVSKIDLNLPTDYNRENTQLSVKQAVEGLRTDEQQRMDQTGTDTTLASSKTDYAAKEAAHKSQLEGIGTAGLVSHGIAWSWSPIIPASSCFEPTMNFLGKSVTFAWCSKIDLLKQILAYAFFIMTGFGIFEIFTRKGG